MPAGRLLTACFGSCSCVLWLARAAGLRGSTDGSSRKGVWGSGFAVALGMSVGLPAKLRYAFKWRLVGSTVYSIGMTDDSVYS